MAAEGGDGGGDQAPGEAALLVSEFPPPPSYYKTHNMMAIGPPPIPAEALKRGTQRAATAAARAREEAERLRLQQDVPVDTSEILGGASSAADGKENQDDGEVVAVFGEVVEDPYLFEPLDHCEDPTVIRDEVIQRNRDVVETFIALVKDLVHNPTENKKRRDELSHKVFEILQECNKFREHQAREILIELLEKQLHKRKALLAELQEEIQRVDDLMGVSVSSADNMSL